MKRILQLAELKIFTIIILISCVLFSGSCSKDKEPEKINERVVLVYAVSSNDLYSSIFDDKSEMCKGMKGIDTDRFRWLVYMVTPGGNVTLEEVKKSGNNMEFKVIKKYDNNTLSTDPARLSQVINDVIKLYKSDSYGLFFWSHSMSWTYGGTPHGSYNPQINGSEYYDGSAEDKFFGTDQTGSSSDHMELDELADAIPSGVFDFIWFDSCYMSGIEVAYQLRGKCDYLVAYPTEIYSTGLNYDAVIPYLMRSGRADLTGAADALFNSYDSLNYACTVAVMDMKYVEEVADISSEILTNYRLVGSSGLQVYSRGTHGPFYDFRQYLKKVADKAVPDYDFSRLDAALQNFVILKRASAYNFNKVSIDKENYSGLSTHLFKGDNSDNEKYYCTLDWYKRTYLKH